MGDDIEMAFQTKIQQAFGVESGNAPRGLDLLARASDLAPNVYSIRLHFAKALLKVGRKDAARKELEVLAKLDTRLPVQHEAAALLSGL